MTTPSVNGFISPDMTDEPTKKGPRQGTLGRGRKPVKGPRNTAIYAAYQNALAGSEYPSIRQWALACDIPYDTFVKYTWGYNLPPLDVAADIAMAAGTTLDALYGHLTKSGHGKKQTDK